MIPMSCFACKMKIRISIRILMKIAAVLPIKILVKFLGEMIKQSMRFHALDCFISFC